jgi:hypothetical protein
VAAAWRRGVSKGGACRMGCPVVSTACFSFFPPSHTRLPLPRSAPVVNCRVVPAFPPPHPSLIRHSRPASRLLTPLLPRAPLDRQGDQGEAARPADHPLRVEPGRHSKNGAAAVPHVRPVLCGGRRALLPGA